MANFADILKKIGSAGKNGISIGDTDFSVSDLSKFFTDITGDINDFGSPDIVKTKNQDPIAGILYAIDDRIKKEYNPYRRTGLYSLGGGLYADGGSILNAISTGTDLLSNAFGQAKGTSSFKDFSEALDRYSNNQRNSLSGISDNSALLDAYGNTAYITGGLKAKDFRNKSLLSDLTDAYAAGVQGSEAGSAFGTAGAILGGIAGTVSSGLGSIIGRNRAARNARKGNRIIGGINNAIDSRLARTGQNVDYNNDLGRIADYMNQIDYSALGGDLHTHGTDFSNGIDYINAGGTHEENPYTGVPYGTADDGTPNLVEEGEVVWNDYVFSNRLYVPEALKKKYRIKKDVTYAEAARKLTGQSSKRPDSNIDRATDERILGELRQSQEQERQLEQMKEMSDMISMQNGKEYAYGGNLFGDGGSTESEATGNTEKNGQKKEKKRAIATGDWKEGGYAENWKKYSEKAILDYAEKMVKRYNEAKSLQDKLAIQREAISTVENLQKSYAQAYVAGQKPQYSANELIKKHQADWNTFGGNANFGNIADNINVPSGADTSDTQEGSWTDGLWGPRTSIRNAGSTLSKDTDLKAISDMFSRMNLDYIPMYGYANGQKLYGLSMARLQNPSQQAQDAVLAAMKKEQKDILDSEERAHIGQPVSPDNYPKLPKNDTKKGDSPYRYAPAIASGLAALHGILGSPDYTDADAIISAAQAMGTPVNIPVETIGNYRRKRPFDERYLVNLANQNKAAAVRTAINNSGGNRAAQLAAASYLANLNQGNIAEVMRQAYLANRQDDSDVSTFNRATDNVNMNAINARNTAQAQLNTNRQAQGLAGITGGRQLRQNIRDNWDANTGTSIDTFINNIASLYKDDVNYNMMRGVVENGGFKYLADILGNISLASEDGSQDDSTGINKAKGGKLNKKKRRF